MGVVLVELGEILVAVSEGLTLNNAIIQELKNLGLIADGSAQQSTLLVVEADVAAIQSEIIDTTYGLAALQIQLTDSTTAILTAIANLTNGTTPVSLPTTPPTGYGGSSSGATAAAVWGDTAAYPTGSKGDELNFATLYAQIAGLQTLAPWYTAPLFYFQRNFAHVAEAPPSDIPNPDVNHILATDTLTTWLTREDTAHTWLHGAIYAGYTSAVSTTTTLAFWTCIYNDDDFLVVRNAMFPTSGVVGAPVWPGLAHVTLGSTLALADGLTVPGPLDGVVVSITAVSYPISFYPFGSLKSYVKVGGIVFVDDNGDGEMAQPLGLASDVVCPRTMAQADHALLRLQSGVVGTITPWLAF